MRLPPVWRPRLDGSSWYLAECELRGSVVGFCSETDKNVLKGYLDLSSCPQLAEENLGGDFAGVSSKELPGMIIGSGNNTQQQHRLAWKDREERRKFVAAITPVMEKAKSKCLGGGEDISDIVVELRKKYASRTSKTVGFQSTVGLVLEGCTVSAVVPGGPADELLGSEKIEPKDKIVKVDGLTCTSATVTELLRGSDVVGSSVRVTVQKRGAANGRYADVTLVRQGAVRTHEIGKMFLWLSELQSDINHGKMPSVKDVDDIEAQAKEVNKESNQQLAFQRSHIGDLEAALTRSEEKDRKELRDTRVCLDSAEQTCADLRSKLAASEQRCSEFQSKAEELLRGNSKDLAAANATYEKEIQALKKQAEQLACDLDTATSARKMAVKECSDVASALKDKQEELARLKSDLEAAIKDTDAKMARLNLDKDKDVARMKMDMEAAMAAQKALRMECSDKQVLMEKLNEMSTRSSAFENAAQRTGEELARVEEELTKVRKELKMCEGREAEGLERIRQGSAMVAALEEQVTDKEKKMQVLHVDLAQLSCEREANLKELGTALKAAEDARKMAEDKERAFKDLEASSQRSSECLKNALKAADEQVRLLGKELQTAREDKNSLEQASREARLESKRLESQLHDAHANLSRAEKALRDSQDECRKAQQLADKAKKDADDAVNKVREGVEALEDLKKQHKREMQDAVSSLSAERDTAQDSLNCAIGAGRELQKEVRALQMAKASLEDLLKQHKQALEDTQSALDEARQEYDSELEKHAEDLEQAGMVQAEVQRQHEEALSQASVAHQAVQESLERAVKDLENARTDNMLMLEKSQAALVALHEDSEKALASMGEECDQALAKLRAECAATMKEKQAHMGEEHAKEIQRLGAEFQAKLTAVTSMEEEGRKALAEAVKKMEEQERMHAQALESLRSEHKKELEALDQKKEATMRACRDEHEVVLKTLHQQNDASVKALRDKCETVKSDGVAALERLKEQQDRELQDLKTKSEAAMVQLREVHAREMQNLRHEHEQALEARKLADAKLRGTMRAEQERALSAMRSECDVLRKDRADGQAALLAMSGSNKAALDAVRRDVQTELEAVRNQYKGELASQCREAEATAAALRRELELFKEEAHAALLSKEKMYASNLQAAQQEHQDQVAAVRKEMQRMESESSKAMAGLIKDHQSELETLQKRHKLVHADGEAALEAARRESERLLSAAKMEHDLMRKESEAVAASLLRSNEARIRELSMEHDKALSLVRTECDDALAAVGLKKDALEALTREQAELLEAVRSECEALNLAMKASEKEREGMLVQVQEMTYAKRVSDEAGHEQAEMRKNAEARVKELEGELAQEKSLHKEETEEALRQYQQVVDERDALKKDLESKEQRLALAEEAKKVSEECGKEQRMVIKRLEDEQDALRAEVERLGDAVANLEAEKGRAEEGMQVALGAGRELQKEMMAMEEGKKGLERLLEREQEEVRRVNEKLCQALSQASGAAELAERDGEEKRALQIELERVRGECAVLLERVRVAEDGIATREEASRVLEGMLEEARRDGSARALSLEASMREQQDAAERRMREVEEGREKAVDMVHALEKECRDTLQQLAAEKDAARDHLQQLTAEKDKESRDLLQQLAAEKDAARDHVLQLAAEKEKELRNLLQQLAAEKEKELRDLLQQLAAEKDAARDHVQQVTTEKEKELRNLLQQLAAEKDAARDHLQQLTAEKDKESRDLLQQLAAEKDAARDHLQQLTAEKDKESRDLLQQLAAEKDAARDHLQQLTAEKDKESRDLLQQLAAEKDAARDHLQQLTAEKEKELRDLLQQLAAEKDATSCAKAEAQEAAKKHAIESSDLAKMLNMARAECDRCHSDLAVRDQALVESKEELRECARALALARDEVMRLETGLATTKTECTGLQDSLNVSRDMCQTLERALQDAKLAKESAEAIMNTALGKADVYLARIEEERTNCTTLQERFDRFREDSEAKIASLHREHSEQIEKVQLDQSVVVADRDRLRQDVADLKDMNERLEGAVSFHKKGFEQLSREAAEDRMAAQELREVVRLAEAKAQELERLLAQERSRAAQDADKYERDKTEASLLCQSLSEENSRLVDEVETLERQVSVLSCEKDQAEEGIDTALSVGRELNQQISALEARERIMQETLVSEQQKTKALLETIEMRDSELARILGQLETERAGICALEEKVSGAVSEVEALRICLEGVQGKACSSLESVHKCMGDTLVQTNGHVKSLQELLDFAREAKAEAEAGCEDARTEAELLRKSNEKLSKDVGELWERCTDLEARHSSALLSLDAVSTQVARCDVELRELFPMRGNTEDGTLECRLAAFYREHNLANVRRAWVLADQYENRVDVLNGLLRKTYGTDLGEFDVNEGAVWNLVKGLKAEEREEADRMLEHVRSLAEQMQLGASLDAHTLSVQLLHGRDEKRKGPPLNADIVVRSMVACARESVDGWMNRGDLLRWHERIRRELHRCEEDERESADNVRSDLDEGGEFMWGRLCVLIEEMLLMLRAQREELRLDVEDGVKREEEIRGLRLKLERLDQQLSQAPNDSEDPKPSQQSSTVLWLSHGSANLSAASTPHQSNFLFAENAWSQISGSTKQLISSTKPDSKPEKRPSSSTWLDLTGTRDSGSLSPARPLSLGSLGWT